MITPTIGAAVLVHIGDSLGVSNATITAVHSDRLIDVSIPTPSDTPRIMTSLRLHQDGDAMIAGDSYAEFPADTPQDTPVAA